MLVGMPEPSDLRLHRADGQCVITAGSVVLFAYGESDVVMRNLAISALRRLGFTGRRGPAGGGPDRKHPAPLPPPALPGRARGPCPPPAPRPAPHLLGPGPRATPAP